ncbi:MAG: MMPL family transporter [Chitinispirillaceae bacterium]|nr:MMPL family transporter [Chitinispirillaceae bacterium]
MVERYIRFLLARRWTVAVVLLASVLVCGYYITTIRIDNDTFKAVPKNIKPRLDYEKLKKDFPAPFNILFLAEFRSGTLAEKVDSLRSWSRRFKGLPGVSGVSDLTTLQVPARSGFLGIGGKFVVPPSGAIDEAKVRGLIAENERFSGIFISRDETFLGMVIALDWNADRTTILNAMLSDVKHLNSGIRVKTYLTSEGAISYFIDKSMKRDFRLLLPVCFLVIFMLLYRVFRRVLHVCAALCAVAVALVWAFGLFGLLKVPFSIVTSIIPVIIFPIGVADAIHLLRVYAGRRVRGDSVEAALISTYRELLLPCFLAALTTFLGFASFSFSSISWNRTFGIYTGIAVLLCYVFNVVLLPLFLSFERNRPCNASPQPTHEERLLDRLWEIFIAFTLRSKRWLFLLPVLIALLVAGSMSVRVENNFMMMLPPHNMLRRSDAFISRHFGGTRFFSVVLEKREGTLSSAGEWKRVDSLAEFLKKQHGVGNVTSLLPLINRVSVMLSKQEISNAAVSLITAGGGLFGKSYGAFIANFLSRDRRRTRLQILCRNDPTVKTLEIAERTESYVQEHLPGYDVLVSGPAILSEAMSAVLVNTLIISLMCTIIPVFLSLVFFFRSPRIGIYCIIPIILLTSFVYAMLGIFRITINLVTVIIMNVCIGIGIDYAIHFVSGYRTARQTSPDAVTALLDAIHQKGTPILFNAMVVGIGFCVLVFSSFPPIRDFGLMVFLSLFVAAGFCITLLTLLIDTFGLSPAPGKRNIRL